MSIYLNEQSDSPWLTAALTLDQPLPSLQPVGWGVGLSVLFTLIALWKFEQTELWGHLIHDRMTVSD